MEKPTDNCCRWIYGDVKSGTASWCDEPARHGQPWCKNHRKVVYVVGRPATRIGKPAPMPILQKP